MQKDHMNKLLEGKLIIVTGASSGVGYATARRLAQTEGATVVAVARRRVFRIEALAGQVGVNQLVAITGDMAAPQEAESIIRQVMERFGRIDGYIHAINRALQLTALDVSDQEFDLTMQVNVKSALYGIQAAAPFLRQQGHGAVVIYNPTPVKTENFVASEAVYSAAAYALSALTQGWTRQLEGHGVRTREVAPSPNPDGGREAPMPHDALLVKALREALAPQPVPLPIRPLAKRPAPVILTARGGLTLAQF